MLPLNETQKSVITTETFASTVKKNALPLPVVYYAVSADVPK